MCMGHNENSSLYYRQYIGGFRRGARGAPPSYLCRLGHFSLNFFSGNYKTLHILVPDARTTLIWHSDFHFCAPSAHQKLFILSVPSAISYGEGYAPLSKILDPPLQYVTCSIVFSRLGPPNTSRVTTGKRRNLLGSFKNYVNPALLDISYTL